MIDFIKSIFPRKKEKVLDEKKLEALKIEMAYTLKDTRTPRLSFPPGFRKDLPTFIILDDSAGATMLFDDTIAKIKKRDDGLADNIQFVKISTSQAVFMLKAEIDRGTIDNIVGAVLDITIGGWAVKNGMTLILDGIDAYSEIRKKFPHAVLRFFTSHSMNEKNAEIYKFMKKYEDLTGEDITKITYMKNPFSTNREDMMISMLQEIKWTE